MYLIVKKLFPSTVSHLHTPFDGLNVHLHSVKETKVALITHV